MRPRERERAERRHARAHAPRRPHERARADLEDGLDGVGGDEVLACLEPHHGLLVAPRHRDLARIVGVQVRLEVRVARRDLHRLLAALEELLRVRARLAAGAERRCAPTKTKRERDLVKRVRGRERAAVPPSGVMGPRDARVSLPRPQRTVVALFDDARARQLRRALRAKRRARHRRVRVVLRPVHRRLRRFHILLGDEVVDRLHGRGGDEASAAALVVFSGRVAPRFTDCIRIGHVLALLA